MIKKKEKKKMHKYFYITYSFLLNFFLESENKILLEIIYNIITLNLRNFYHVL